MLDETDPAGQQEGAPEDATTVTDPQVTEEAAESPEESGEGAGAPQEDQEEKAPEVEIVLDGEEPQQPKEAAPAWVKDLRKENRALKARAAELERKLQSQGQTETVADPGPEPTLEDDDVNFDTTAYKAKLKSWTEAQQRKEAEIAAHQRAWTSRLDAYGKAKEELSKQLPEYEDAEATVKATFNDAQQGLILRVAGNAALVIAALGQKPELAKDLAETADPVDFIAKVAKLEVRLKMKPKNQPPPPEKPITGSGSKSGSGDPQLERLRAKADKDGNRTPVVEYLRSKRDAQR